MQHRRDRYAPGEAIELGNNEGSFTPLRIGNRLPKFRAIFQGVLFARLDRPIRT
jgi:hypothetical protein